EGKHDAEREADTDADASQRHDLSQEHDEDEAAAGAETFEGRDVVAAAVEIGAYRVGHADTADDQRRQADERQERTDLLDEAADARCRIPAIARLPTGVREFGINGLEPRLDVLAAVFAGRQCDAIIVVDQASGLDEAGRAERKVRDQNAWPEREAARN